MAHAKGLRDRRVMTRYAGRNAILPPLNGFAAQFATAVGGLVFIEFVFSYPGAGLTLQQAALGNDYPLTQALLLVFAVCVIVANFIMDILNLVLDPRVRRRRRRVAARSPTVDAADASSPLAVVARRARAGSRCPAGCGCCSATRSRASASSSSRSMVLLGARRAADRGRHDPTDSRCSTRGQAPSWHHLFGTTDQGTDIFAQVVLGRAALAAARRRRRAASRPCSPRRSASSPPTRAAWSTTSINFMTNVFLVIPTIPLLIVISALPPDARA